MREMEIQRYAQQLLKAHGDKAVVEAAQRHAIGEQGQHNEARTWKRVEAALRIMRGPNQS